MSQKKKLVLTIISCTLFLVILFTILHLSMNKSDFNFDKIDKINLYCENQNVQLSNSDKNDIKRVLSNGQIAKDNGLSCGVNKSIKIVIGSEGENLTIFYPEDNCGNLKIENTDSKYITIDQEQKNHLNTIIKGYTNIIDYL